MNGHDIRTDDIPEYHISSFISDDSFLYHSGFLQSNFSDTTLIIRTPHLTLQPYALHALIIARSPRLFEQLKHGVGPPYAIHLDSNDPNLTTDGIQYTLGTLYSGRKDVPESLSLGVFAAGIMLGLPELSRSAWSQCHARYTQIKGLQEGFDFVLSSGSNYPHSTTLLDDLKQVLITNTPSPESDTLLTTLPFEIVKSVLESESLRMDGRERYAFARTVIARRKPRQPAGIEESVVMAFGGTGSGVEVLRRDRTSKKKTLWKANGRS